MKFLIVLFIGCAFAKNLVKRDVDDPVWDEIIDQAIDAARGDIIDKHLDLISIPDLKQSVQETVFGIPFTVDADLKNMTFWNVSTVKRTGPVTVLQDDVSGNITISTGLGLDTFYFACNNLNIKVFGLNVIGSLSSHCDSNSIEFSVSLITDKEGNCVAHVNWARIVKLNKFTVEIKPNGVLNWLAEHLSSLILNDFSSKIMDTINLGLADRINDAISKIDICGYVPI